MNNTDEKIEKLIEKTVQLLDEGKSVSDILNLFPERQNELKEIIKIIDVLAAEREKVAPPRELLSRILAQISSVTKEETSRYLFKRGGKTKGRPSLINIIKNQYTMATNWKIIAPIGVLALVVAVVLITQLGGKPQEVPGPAPIAEQPTVAELPPASLAKPPVATGNVDDVVNALFTDSSDEISQITKAMDDDVAIVGLDSQAISDFGQSYDENDF